MILHAVYVIFGATGSIGQDLAKRLLGAKHKVILAANSGEKLDDLKKDLSGGETKEVDVMKSKEVSAFIPSPFGRASPWQQLFA